VLKILVLVISLGLMACSTLQRSDQSGYNYINEAPLSKSSPKNYYQAKRVNRVNQVKAELGYENQRMLTESDAAKLKLRMMLRSQEDQLTHRAEKQQYYKLKPHFKNDVERIRFLQLPSDEMKRKWIQAKGISSDEESYDDRTIAAIESNDVIRGMTMKAVKESWGDPDFVEVAGDKLYGNQRWGYKKYVSSESGYNKEQRIIIFEAGRVAGWDRR
jgi:hypothetical protein